MTSSRETTGRYLAGEGCFERFASVAIDSVAERFASLVRHSILIQETNGYGLLLLLNFSHLRQNFN